MGEAVTSAGIIFTNADNVIPDVVWIAKERLASVLDDAGHLTAAPELVVEVLSEIILRLQSHSDCRCLATTLNQQLSNVLGSFGSYKHPLNHIF
ncbi:Uma2 family endonuclease [Plectonema radiosum]|uniref:Uma2 family endonuclease n=1 Tax=Plectonema radiosum TaxID=945768 RepID=UPI0035C89706